MRISKGADSSPAKAVPPIPLRCSAGAPKRGAQRDVRSSDCRRSPAAVRWPHGEAGDATARISKAAFDRAGRRSPVAAAWPRGEAKVARPGALKAALVCANRSVFACRGDMAAWRIGAMRPRVPPIPRRCSAGRQGSASRRAARCAFERLSAFACRGGGARCESGRCVCAFRRFRGGVLRGDRGARHGAQRDVRSSDCQRSPAAAAGRVVNRGDASVRSADSTAVFCGSAKAQRDVRSSVCRRSPVAAAWPRGEAGDASVRISKAASLEPVGVHLPRRHGRVAKRGDAPMRISKAAWRSGVACPGALKAALVCADRWFSPAAAAWPRGEAGRCARAHIEGRVRSSRSALICRGGGARRKTRYIIGRNAG